MRKLRSMEENFREADFGSLGKLLIVRNASDKIDCFTSWEHAGRGQVSAESSHPPERALEGDSSRFQQTTWCTVNVAPSLNPVVVQCQFL